MLVRYVTLKLDSALSGMSQSALDHLRLSLMAPGSALVPPLLLVSSAQQLALTHPQAIQRPPATMDLGL